jgi:hypothetical protein
LNPAGRSENSSEVAHHTADLCSRRLRVSPGRATADSRRRCIPRPRYPCPPGAYPRCRFLHLTNETTSLNKTDHRHHIDEVCPFSGNRKSGIILVCTKFSSHEGHPCPPWVRKLFTAFASGCVTTTDSSQIGHPYIGQALKVRGYCGDGRAVIQPNFFPDTEQVLKAAGLSGSGECPI